MSDFSGLGAPGCALAVTCRQLSPFGSCLLSLMTWGLDFPISRHDDRICSAGDIGARVTICDGTLRGRLVTDPACWKYTSVRITRG